ncbi:MAG: SCP2 sterol-binding domain-containing protein [Candidatus Marithrix sp.]|nr:SCP2 sterol-binding domain-containing protein [Candidatus Marithrix sp.]
MKQILATTIALLLNQTLQLNPLSLTALKEIADKIIRINLIGTGYSFSLFPDEQGIFILNNYLGEADVTIETAPFTLSHLVLNATANLDNTTEINIIGDKEIATKLLVIIKELNIDWEKQLSKKLGSVAYIFGDTIRSSQEYMSNKINNLEANLIHQLNLPTRVEMQNFTSAIEILSSDLEHLEQKVQELT